MRPCHVLRVFTKGDAGGNHLGVVADITDLDDGEMQAIAADLGFSETIFIEWHESDVPNIRIFTPAAEMAFAGHPLVGAAWTLASMGPGGVDAITCGIGEVKIGADDDSAHIEVPLVADVSEAGEAYATTASLPIPSRAWRVALPQVYMVLEVDDPDAVAAAAPAMDQLMSEPGTYLVARDGDGVKARFFAPLLGVPEDPATGSAAFALAAVRSFEGAVEGEVIIDQGAEVGMASRIDLSWDGGVVRLGGTVRRDEVRILD